MLTVEHLSLRNWRSFTAQDFSFHTGLNVLIGRNAVGKTNTIEALQLLTSGMSFRASTSAQLLKEGTSSGYTQARLTGDGRVIDVRCEVKEGKRTFIRNGKHARGHELPKTLMSVLFNPDDLSLVKRGASGRRGELDAFGRQVNAGYGKVLRTYLRSIEQRNRLLKDEFCDTALLGAWDASVALGAATLLEARLKLLQRLRPHLIEAYQTIAGGEQLQCSYLCSLAPCDADSDLLVGEEDSSTERALLSLGRDGLTSCFLNALTQHHEADLRRGQTLIGPHRDDICFSINGRDARSFASQGQQRSVVLAWKMAEVALAEELLDTKPLLLLDDVMSELDGERRSAATRFVQDGMQTIITTTNLGYFPDELLDQAKVITVG